MTSEYTNKSCFGIMKSKSLEMLGRGRPPRAISVSSERGIILMKHALPLAFALALTASLVASVAGGNPHVQTNAPGASQSTTAAAIYGRRCASCHGKDGRANTFKGKLRSARNLTGPQWQEDVSDERIFNSITNGRGKMPSFGKKLSEAEINSLVSYVRGLKK